MQNKSPQITVMHWLCYLGHSFTYQRSPQLAKIDGSSGEAPSPVGGQTLTDSTHQVDPWAPRPLRYRTNIKFLSQVDTNENCITVTLRDTFTACINMRQYEHTRTRNTVTTAVTGRGGLVVRRTSGARAPRQRVTYRLW